MSLIACKDSRLRLHFKTNSYSEREGVTHFNLVLSVQQVVRFWSLARPPQRSAWRCPHRQSYGTPAPPSHPPAPTPSAAWPRVRMKRMPVRKAAAETLHWSSQMRRRYMLTQPSWASQKLSCSKAQTTATHRPPSGHGWQTHSFKLISGWKPVLHQVPDRRSAEDWPDVSSWLNATLWDEDFGAL